MTQKEYDRDNFWIHYGHRHPHLNEAVGGASKSRHIVGEAVDMVIGDINKDGLYTDEDKQIVIDLCEQKIIKISAESENIPALERCILMSGAGGRGGISINNGRRLTEKINGNQ